MQTTRMGGFSGWCKSVVIRCILFTPLLGLQLVCIAQSGYPLVAVCTMFLTSLGLNIYADKLTIAIREELELED
jgi:hypothetical protein